MSPNPRLQVVIVSHRCKELLRACLGSLRDNPATGGMVVRVVDNASGDGTAEIVRREFPEVSLIVAPRNIGFAAANNVGIRAGNAPYVLVPEPGHAG